MIVQGMTRGALPKFTRWLVANGAEKLAPTNQYELLRFRTVHGVSIVYCNKAGNITSATNDVDIAWRCYTLAIEWRAFPALARRRRGSVDEETLRQRDGDACFFCARPLEDDVSVEHLVARTHGGPNHISNKFLAHRLCNSQAGHLSAPEKIRRHVLAQLAIVSRTRVTDALLDEELPF